MMIITKSWAEPDVEARIKAHVHAWELAREQEFQRLPESLAFVTISREFGCESLRITHSLVGLLNQRYQPTPPWVAYDREVLDRVAQELHLRREVVESLDGTRRDEMTELFETLLNRKVTGIAMFRKLAEVVRSLALHGHCVIVGRGGHLLTVGLNNGLRVHLQAPREWRVNNVAEKRGLPRREAERIVAEGEREREHFLRTYFIYDPDHPHLPDLALNVSQFSPDQAAEAVLGVMAARFAEIPRQAGARATRIAA